jgi:DNA-binding TFAR19-related protein (PDSD5 family)
VVIDGYMDRYLIFGGKHALSVDGLKNINFKMETVMMTRMEMGMMTGHLINLYNKGQTELLNEEEKVVILNLLKKIQEITKQDIRISINEKVT